MTIQERVQAVVEYGFTERQARFLVLVMRHAGLCVKRQYAAFAGIANGGDKCNALFDKLVRRGFAVATDCLHNRARLYHVHSKLLYHAIGEPDGRYRRALPARSAPERLMRLDAALMSPELDWLATRSEKLAYLQPRVPAPPPDKPLTCPSPASSASARQCPGTFPIGIDPTGRLVLLYLVTAPWTDDFRRFLVGHTALLAVTPAWTLKLVVPQALRRAVAAYEAVIREELKSPLSPDEVSMIGRYFFHRQRGTDVATAPEGIRTYLNHCMQVYVGPRFEALYRRWLTEDRAALAPVWPAIPEALASGRARVESVILPHTYEHLSPVVSRHRVRRRRPRQPDEEGDGGPHSINPSLNPVP